MRLPWTWITRNWTLKLAALATAVLLWVVVKSEDLVTVTVSDVPVRVSVRDPSWELAGPAVPEQVTVELTGMVRDMLHLTMERPQILVPVENVRDSVQIVVLRDEWVQLVGDLARARVDDVRPATVRLVFDRVAARELPVALPLRGRLAAGLVLSGPVAVEPETVHATGPRRRLLEVDSIRLPALDLGHITDTTVVRMDIDTAGLGLELRPTSVRVTVPVGPAPSPPDSQAVDSAAAAAARADSAAAGPTGRRR